jgi:hypothetical protein
MAVDAGFASDRGYRDGCEESEKSNCDDRRNNRGAAAKKDHREEQLRRDGRGNAGEYDRSFRRTDEHRSDTFHSRDDLPGVSQLANAAREEDHAQGHAQNEDCLGHQAVRTSTPKFRVLVMGLRPFSS